MNLDQIILNENCDNTGKCMALKLFLQLIEIETSSYCNRRCWFCTNSLIDRHSKNLVMPENTYLSIIESLSSISYKGAIAFSRYNEPLSHRDLILMRIGQAKQYCPNAFLYTHTNGDYLTKEYLLDLSEAGLDLLAIQCYLGIEEEFDIDNIIIPRMKKIIQKLELEHLNFVKSETHCSVKLIMPQHYKMKIIIQCMNFKNAGTNRGDTLKTIKGTHRIRPCYSPFYRMYIDYDGSVMPCCQLRHDIESHKHLICGNVNTNSIFDIFMNENYVKIRELLKSEGNKASPCRSCNATECDDVYDYYKWKSFPYSVQ